MSQLPPEPLICPACGAQIAPTLLACPNCGRLIYSDRLSQLAEAARVATEKGDISSALSAWREALDLLPSDSRQYQGVAARITQLGRQLQEQGSPPSPAGGDPSTPHSNSAKGKAAAGLGAIGLVLLGKAKLLLLGLSKLGTLLSMLASFGVYWSIWGWQFALGLVLCTYVHEMGHVVALRKYGFKASAPMFIPGLGALIRLQQRIVDPREDAAIGLAGPIYGMGAAIVTAGAWYVTHRPILAVIAGVNAWINLFNLLPVWTLDGGRAFHSLSRPQRFIAAASCGAAYLLTRYFNQPDGLVLLVGIVCLFRAFSEKTDERQNDPLATVQYVALVLTLTMLSLIRFESGIKI